jgi:hypothetical protein
MKRNGPKAQTTVHGPLGITNVKPNVIADCLENQFKSHDLCDENQDQQVVTRVQAPLASVNDIPFGKVRPCDMHKLAN